MTNWKASHGNNGQIHLCWWDPGQDAISCWCWLPVAAEAGSVRVRVSWAQCGAPSRLSHDKPCPARPDTIFKGCSMLIVPGTRQPTQCGRLPVKMPAHKLSPSSKVRWQHCTGAASGGHYNVITAGINSDEVYCIETRIADITRHSFCSRPSCERTYLQTTSDMDRIIYGLMECFQIVINKDEVKSLTENISRTTWHIRLLVLHSFAPGSVTT